MTLPGQTKKSVNTLCQIIKEQEYDDSLREISRDYSRLDELDSAIDWALSRGPDKFTELEEGYYIWKTNKIPNFPSLRILYKYDKDLLIVTLLSIDIVEE